MISLLAKNEQSQFRESHGATGSQPSCYRALDQIFGDDTFDETDAVIDVGCGKGRVLACLVRRGAPGSLTGIELDPKVAAEARAWDKRYGQSTVLDGDAFALDYNDYTVLLLARPFEKERSDQFIDLLEEKLTHPIRLYCWYDLRNGTYLENRVGWKMIRRGWVFYRHFLFLYQFPQRYTVWTYTPEHD